MGSSASDDSYESLARQNKRDADSRIAYSASKGKLQMISYPETCQRCGRDFGARVHIWNGKRLCNSCVETEQRAWTLFSGGPDGAPYHISAQSLKKVKWRSLLEAFITKSLALLGLQRIEKTIEKTVLVATAVLPIKKVLSLVVLRPDKKNMPILEGLMNRKKRVLRS
jgi:hypothetical protein